jgi:hypothetical protein
VSAFPVDQFDWKLVPAPSHVPCARCGQRPMKYGVQILGAWVGGICVQAMIDAMREEITRYHRRRGTCGDVT